MWQLRASPKQRRGPTRGLRTVIEAAARPTSRLSAGGRSRDFHLGSTPRLSPWRQASDGQACAGPRSGGAYQESHQPATVSSARMLLCNGSSLNGRSKGLRTTMAADLTRRAKKSQQRLPRQYRLLRQSGHGMRLFSAPPLPPKRHRDVLPLSKPVVAVSAEITVPKSWAGAILHYNVTMLEPSIYIGVKH